MELGDSMMLLRKTKVLSQADLGKMIGNSGDVIGRYERDHISPFIDVAEIVADALEVSIDYLIGKTKMVLDKQTFERLEYIAKPPDDKKNYLYSLIDMFLRDFKFRKSFIE